MISFLRQLFYDIGLGRQKPIRKLGLVNLHNYKVNLSDTRHSSMSNCMKSLALWPCILGPYVPLRTSSKRERVANELCLASRFTNRIVQIDEL